MAGSRRSGRSTLLRMTPQRRAVLHDHALCLGCQSLVDVAPTRPSRSALRFAAAKGFQVNGHHTQFVGLCADCVTPPDAAEKD